MKSKFAKFALVVAFGLAFTFASSCTSGGEDGEGTSSSGKGGGISSAGNGEGTSSPGNGGGTSSPGNGGGTSSAGNGGGTSSLGNGGGTSSASNGGVGDNLTLSGQVYTLGFDFETMNMEYIPYTGPNLTFASNTGAKGSINGGKMSFTTGTPSANILEPFEGDEDDDFYPDATVSPSDTKGIGLDFDIGLSKSNIISMDISIMGMTMEMEAVGYLYVDRDCIITAPGGTTIEDGEQWTYKKLNLNLKKGWNSVKMNINTSSRTGSTASMTTGDCSDCKWTLEEDDDDYDYYGSIRSKSLPQLTKMAKRSIQQAISANK